MYNILNIPFFYNIFWGEKGKQGLCKESVGKMLSSCVTHLIFVSKANNFFVSLISNYCLSRKF